jgi:hypothetical protein
MRRKGGRQVCRGDGAGSLSLERNTVEAIAGLVALALERARFLTEVSRTEALRQKRKIEIGAA